MEGEMSKKIKISFICIVEAGDLERKVILLGESLRRVFANKDDVPIFAVRPRKGREIGKKTMETFNNLGIKYIYKPINVKWRNLAFANQVYGPALIEEQMKDKTEILVYLDADIVCLKMPDKLFLKDKEKVLVVPIDVKDACGVLYGESFPSNWNFVYDLNSINKNNLWTVVTNVDNSRIYPCFNSGLIAVRPEVGIFRKWKEMLEGSIDKGYFGKFSPISKEFFFTDQVFLASAILSLANKDEIVVMNKNYNFPLSYAKRISEEDGVIDLNTITFLHYHKSFYNLEWVNYVYMNDEIRSWLMPKLPLIRDRKTARYRLKTEIARQYLIHYYWKIKGILFKG